MTTRANDAPFELTADELGKTLQAEAHRVVSLANHRERWLRVDLETKVPPDQKFSIFVQGWQSRIYYTYSVDVRPVVPVAIVQRADRTAPEAIPGKYEVWRHLSIQQSVPQQLSTAELNLHQQQLLGLYQPMVQAFFPLAQHVRAQFAVGEPIPVQHPARTGQGRRANPLTWRTVVTAHFVVPWSGDQTPYIIEEAPEA